MKKIVLFIMLLMGSSSSTMLWNEWDYDEDAHEDLIINAENKQLIVAINDPDNDYYLVHRGVSFFVIKNEEELHIHPLNRAPKLRFIEAEQVLELLENHCIVLGQNELGLFKINLVKKPKGGFVD